MTTTLTCAILATVISFLAGWLLARLSMAALLVCMPRRGAATRLTNSVFRRYSDFSRFPSAANDSGGSAFAWCKPPAADP